MLCLRLFGGASLLIERGAPGGGAGQPRRLALLALLATARSGAISREKLTAYLWPETGPAQGRRLLTESLYVLRKALGARALASEGENIRLEPDLVTCDVVEFEVSLERGNLEHAVSLYTGPFLDGFFVQDAPEFELWTESERRRLADRYASALESLVGQAEAENDHAAAVGWLKRLVVHDPYNSRFALRLMKAMAAAGDPANALQHAQEHARFLERELGVEPSAELLAFLERLKRELTPHEVAEEGSDKDDHATSEHTAAVADPAETAGRRPRRLNRRTAALTVVSAVAVCGVIAVLWLGVPTLGERGTPRGASIDPANRIAVLPFTYRGGQEFAYLGETLDELLSTTLDDVGDIQTCDPRAVLGILAQEPAGGIDSERGRVVAEQLGAGRYVLGNVVEVEERLRIDARLLTPGDEPPDVGVATVEGNVGEFYALIDGLTRQLLLAAVGEVREYDHLAARTTDSLNALKAYLEGITQLRAGQYVSSYAAFQRAVEIDSTFALAWYGIMGAGGWVGRMEWDRAMEAARKAVRHSGRLPPRAQDVLKAWAAIMHGDGPEAERLSRAVLSRYPNDVEAWDALAHALAINDARGRASTEYFDTWKRLFSYDPHNPYYRFVVTRHAATRGDWARFDSLLSPGANVEMSLGHPSDWSLNWRAVRAFGAGNQAEQDQIILEARQAANALPLGAGIWVARVLKDIPAAAQLARLAVLDSLAPAARALAHVELAGLELALGRWNGAQAQLDAVARLNPTWAILYRGLWASSVLTPLSQEDLVILRDSIAARDVGHGSPSVTHTGARAHDLLAPQLRLYVLGRLSERLGHHELALRFAAALEDLGNSPEALSYFIDRVQSLRAQVLFDQGRLQQAFEALEAQPGRIRLAWPWEAPFYRNPKDRFLRGEILMALEHYDEALRSYASIEGLHAHHLAASHLRRGEIYELLGQREKAALHYREFMRLWRDCDPELRPMVEQTRLALERLTSESARP